jgi:hypothetical protein
VWLVRDAELVNQLAAVLLPLLSEMGPSMLEAPVKIGQGYLSELLFSRLLY